MEGLVIKYGACSKSGFNYFTLVTLESMYQKLHDERLWKEARTNSTLPWNTTGGSLIDPDFSNLYHYSRFIKTMLRYRLSSELVVQRLPLRKK